MTDEELKAAAERIAAHRRRDRYEHPTRTALDAYMRDAEAVADACLARLAADEAVTSAAQRCVSTANEEINKLRDAVHRVLCDPGNPELSDSTVAALQAMRGPAVSPSEFVVVRRNEWESVNAKITSDEAERVERAKPIDEEWLLSNGAQYWQPGEEYNFECGLRWSKHLGESGILRGGVYIEPVDLNGRRQICHIPCVTTRGQLLDLLRALKGGAE